MKPTILAFTALASFACPIITRAMGSDWPFMTIRQTSAAVDRGEKLKEIIAVNARHPGSADEYWLAFRPGRPVDATGTELARYKPYVSLLREAGITVGSQQGETLGHAAIAVTPGLFSDDAWQVDRRGRRLQLLCPRSPEVLAYEESLVEMAVRTLGLESVWLDDDLRLGGGKEEGCFCARCIKAFNDEYRLDLTREQLVERLDSTEKREELRRKWYLFKNKTLAVFAAAARRGADRVSEDVRLGYQSIHSLYLPAGESYLPLLKELAGTNGLKSAIRVGSGNYFESLSENYAKAFSVMRESERCRRAGFVAQISYEQETHTREVLHKSAEAALIESVMALAAGADALTEYWWSAERDEPVAYYEEFAAMVVEWRPYLERMAEISRKTSIAGLARFRGSDHLLLADNLFDDDDFAFGAIGIPMAVDDSTQTVWYVNAKSLDEWGAGDAERLAGKGAVVDSAVFERLLACGGDPVARGVREGRIVPFDFSLARLRKKRTMPTHAERKAFQDAIEKVSPLPVRIERAHPLYLFPRVDAEGRVRAVSIFNGSIGKCLPTEVIVRNPASSNILWRRPGESPLALPMESRGTDFVVKIPGIPGAHVGTLMMGD